MMIRSDFQIFFLPKKQCKALYCGLAEGEIIFFTAAHVMLCCVFVPKTALLSQQCFTSCWAVHSIHQTHSRKASPLLTLPLQEAGRRWMGVWERTQMKSWPTKRYSRPCNSTLGNNTAGCFSKESVTWWASQYWSAESDVNISTCLFYFDCTYWSAFISTHKFSDFLSFQFSPPSYWGGMRKKLGEGSPVRQGEPTDFHRFSSLNPGTPSWVPNWKILCNITILYHISPGHSILEEVQLSFELDLFFTTKKPW